MTTDLVEVLDPRMPPVAGIELAPRLGTLSGRTVLLLDNGKCRAEFGHLEVVFEVLEPRLHDAEVATVLRHTVDLLRLDEPQLVALAEELCGRADGVVLGVADTGVSSGTVMLAAELERRGQPTVVICQGIGETVAATMAGHLVPGLPLPTLATWRLATPEDVATATAALWSEIASDLTAAPARRADSGGAAGAAGTARPVLSLSAADVHGDFTAAMAAEGYGDGLPLRAPTPAAVEEMLAAMGVDASAVVWGPVPPRPEPVRAGEIAALAAMAGCPPAVGPIVLEAYRAMGEPEFRLFQAAITTHPAGTLVLVSGPASAAAGMNHGYGALGPGNRATATTGRAVALGYSFLLGMLPGRGDLTLQGSPAELSYCTAEDVGASPWPGLHADLGHPDGSTVTVLKCEAPHNVLDNTSKTPESLLRSVADTASSLGGNNLYNPRAQTVVFLNPEHAHIVARQGWSRHDVQRFLFEHARRPRADLVGRGIATTWSPWIGESVPIVEDPRDLMVVVVGAPGPQSQVAIPWGYSRGVTRRVDAAR